VPTIKPTDPIRHRHADGTEHSHGGRDGFTFGAQVIKPYYGDEPTHSHSTLSLASDETGPNTGSVVWSERTC